MSEGMQYGQHGQYRRDFYSDVCKRADEILARKSPESAPSRTVHGGSPTGIVDVPEGGQKMTVETTARALTEHLLSKVPGGTKSSHSNLLVIVSFDEAQMLDEVDTKTTDTTWTLFAEVRRCLRIIRELPIFALFLSTVGKLEQFSPPPQLGSSTRIVRTELRPFEPIVVTPLDVLAQRITGKKVWTLEEVASTYHMVHLGRPLFAAMYDAAKDDISREGIFTLAGQKLLKSSVAAPCAIDRKQALTCIAVRIPIEFNRVPLSDYLRPEDVHMERSLVADHMRILLYAGIGFTPIITTSASEPFLAEAAYNTMVGLRWGNGKLLGTEYLTGLQPFSLIIDCLQSSLLDLGPRGEFVTALLLLYARDCATTLPLSEDEPPGASPTGIRDAGNVHEYDGAYRRRIITVSQLLRTLFGESHFNAFAGSLPRAYQSAEASKTPLGDAFKDGFVYFNHFIKVQSFDVVNQEYLLLAISRGAAIICADNDIDIDIVVPVLIGTVLKKEKVTAILIQARNSRHYGAKVQYSVFANMNPYRCGLFASDVEDPPPVLRMVFALASKRSAVNQPSEGQRQSAQTKKPKNAKFTAYDIWCAGASQETFAVIHEDEVVYMVSLLEMLRDRRDVLSRKVYERQVRRGLREMQPLVSTHPDNISRFADPPSKEEYPIAEDADEGTIDSAT
ncbi:hypothetical protein K466DRAFT_592374 [Polyporus arcularius HHB13444]|uniref:Uncharacterized protein n=1 Tax=Polyporus arcularius HHB13444 TaxID=1314778 RepID=A0A5C3NRW7_9APHY|nr:hypothetical protein K466DRAFT_592374 [Polyporus arcularius HHB13444]